MMLFGGKFEWVKKNFVGGQKFVLQGTNIFMEAGQFFISFERIKKLLLRHPIVGRNEFRFFFKLFFLETFSKSFFVTSALAPTLALDTNTVYEKRIFFSLETFPKSSLLFLLSLPLSLLTPTPWCKKQCTLVLQDHLFLSVITYIVTLTATSRDFK